MKRMTMKPFFCGALALIVGSLVSTSTQAEPAGVLSIPNSTQSTVVAPLSQRFTGGNVTELPDFQKHVVPLLGRLGCNGRACHGSFQGRGGFQLSLFGYDFKADHAALLEENAGRVDVDDVDESLMLAKPLDADMHEGGKLIEDDSWQHQVLRQWIAGGATHPSEQPQTLVRLEVTPAEIQFESDHETVSLRAIACWQDGVREDVTELCRFSSNDDSIAAINADGMLASGQSGDTHVVVYYDNAVVPVPVMRRVADGATDIKSPSSYRWPIDQRVAEKLNKLGIVAAGQCSDTEFIRRASLDITGILPSADAVRDFLVDTAPDKREQMIDELLDSPGYAAWWATRLSDWTGNSDEQLNNVLPVRSAASKLWYEWLRTRIEQNVPYDELVEGIVTAQSRQPGEDYRQYCESMTKACVPGGEALYAKRDGLAMFWARRNFQKPEERAIGFAYAFLGVRIECAQCHKHPFDQWSKNDFEQFSKLFTPIRANQNLVANDAKGTRDELLEKLTGGKKLNNGELKKAVYRAAESGEIVPFGELVVNTKAIPDKVKKARKDAEKKGRKVAPLNIPSGQILGQSETLLLDEDPRAELMAWLRSPENPYFAKAIVNRVWSNYFGIGIVDPSDDMNLANPPSNAPLLDDLANQLIANKFDLKWLHRTITTSQTYQRSSQTNLTNEHDRTNFSRHFPRRLPAEVVYDCVVLATGSDDQAEQLRTDMNEMAIADGKPRLRNKQDFALEVFGQSSRESNCDCDRSDSPSLLQSIYLRNDTDMYKRLADKNGWVNQACKSLGVAGPDDRADPQAMAMSRRVQAMQEQLTNRIKQFNSQPIERQSRLRRQLEGEYARLAKKLKSMDYSTPNLDELIANPAAWDELDGPSETSLATGGKLSFAQIVDEAYLRSLSRFPDSEETAISVEFLEQSKTPADGLQSLLWALVNTKEFIITH